VHQQGEACGMRFRKPVFAEALDLVKNLLRELFRIPAAAHALDQLLLEWTKAAAAFPRCHRTPQLVGLAGGKTCCDDGKLHYLFLENRYAQRTLEDRADILARILDLFLLVTPAQIRMHHVALY